MSAYAFELAGTIVAQPQGAGSGDGYPVIPIDERLTLKHRLQYDVDLLADPVVNVNLGGLVAGAHLVFLKVTGGDKVRVRLTSADGSQQIVPLNTFMLLISETVPFTAIDLTRTTGSDTTVQVFLGEKA